METLSKYLTELSSQNPNKQQLKLLQSCLSTQLEQVYSDHEEDDQPQESSENLDMEDLGTQLSKPEMNEIPDENGIIFVNPKKTHKPPPIRKEMVTPEIRKALEKQGYKIVGSHSGVKICRWTKSMLRGRGGCYKHSFYGIDSHRCMESTPSLACANKCVFCWVRRT